ncbi:MAG: phosphodiester glycosidase family protein, partial [Akkermansiaceae bacterium]
MKLIPLNIWLVIMATVAGYSQEIAAQSRVGEIVGSSLKHTPLVEKKIQFEGVKYRVVHIHPSQLELAWKNDTGKPLRSFPAVQAHYLKKQKKVTFVMNAGIFEPGGIPSGLHVQNGVLLRPINLRAGRGNFYLKPNGVFAIYKTNRISSIISPSEKYGKLHAIKVKENPGLMPTLALQSGPLLLENGKIHPAFNRSSKSRLHRNGVGIDANGMVVFAITEFYAGKAGEVNLHGFARFFLHLGC